MSWTWQLVTFPPLDVRTCHLGLAMITNIHFPTWLCLAPDIIALGGQSPAIFNGSLGIPTLHVLSLRAISHLSQGKGFTKWCTWLTYMKLQMSMWLYFHKVICESTSLEVQPPIPLQCGSRYLITLDCWLTYCWLIVLFMISNTLIFLLDIMRREGQSLGVSYTFRCQVFLSSHWPTLVLPSSACGGKICNVFCTSVSL